MKSFFEDIVFYLKNRFSNRIKIKGKCKACGECCRTIVFYVGKNPIKTEEQFELLKKWDKKYNRFEISGTAEDGALYFKCKALKENGKCSAYFFRSVACRMYPKYQAPLFSRGDGLKPSCGYFIEVEKKFQSFMDI